MQGLLKKVPDTEVLFTDLTDQRRDAIRLKAIMASDPRVGKEKGADSSFFQRR
jgi:hypothetical protein